MAVLENAEPEELEDEYEAVEGTVLLRVHRVRERKRGFRERLLKRAAAQEGGIACEACGLKPRFPGAIGLAIFEVHHAVPLSEVSTTVTRLDDLALLCSNCHRMIHAVMRADAAHCTLPMFKDRLPLVK